MSRPAFLDAPYRKETFSDSKMFRFVMDSPERHPAITDVDKAKLREQYPNRTGATPSGNNTFSVWGARTEYQAHKIAPGVFLVRVYAISNSQDTSRPKDSYFLIEKEAAAS